jgi:hypothetical protein
MTFKYFIYCSGKTGSCTLAKSFNTMEKGSAIHVHNTDHWEKIKKKHKKHKNDYTLKSFIVDSSNVHDNIYVIDSFRPPIERAISSFFYHIDHKVPTWKNMNVEDLIKIFNEKKYYKLLSNNHSYFESFNMFDLSTDIEIDHDLGYYITKYKNITFIKTSLLHSDRWEHIFKTLIDKRFELIKSNETNGSENKQLSDIYAQFKREYRVPINYINNLHNENVHNEMKKMMRKNEIDKYIVHWKQKAI